MRLRLALAAWALALPAGAADLPALHAVTGVGSGDVLNIRAAPSAGAARLGALAPDARDVEVVELSPDGRWGRVNAGEGSGWVSLRYLAAQPGPAWHEMRTPLACYGTEPFWALAADPAAGTATLERPGEDPAALRIDWSAPAAGRGGILGWSLSGAARGFAVLRAGPCSDGMSDRVMGLSLELFLNGPEGPAGHSGCCRLVP